MTEPRNWEEAGRAAPAVITVPSDPLDEILEAAGIPAGVRVPPPPTAEALAMTIEQVVSAFRISFNDAAEVVGQVIDSLQAWLRSLPNEEARVRGIIATQRRRRHRHRDRIRNMTKGKGKR